MSKAIEGAAMLGGALLLATGMLLPGTSELLNNPLAYAALKGLVLGGISMEAGQIADSLTSNRGMGVTTRQPAANRQCIYGTQRVPGNIVYCSTTGSKKDQYNFVIVLAGHRCDTIVNMYLDGRQVHWEAGSVGNETRSGINFGGHCDGNTYTGPNGVQYNFGAGNVYCQAYYGDQTNQPNTVPGGGYDTGLFANDPVWGPSPEGLPYLGGCTYLYLKIEYNVTNFPQLPEIRFTINGKNDIFDPRTGTTGFTTNTALIAADLITNSIFGLDDPTVNVDQLIAAANVCDEQVALAAGGTEARFACNYHFDTGTAPGDALATIMDGCAGRLSRIGGEWFIWPSYWQGPSFSFDANALTGTVQWESYRSISELFNRVNGTYVAANYPYNAAGNYYDGNGFADGEIQNNFNLAFQPDSYPQYACDTAHGYAADQYLAEDGGRVLPKTINLNTVLSVCQAQRVAKINLLRNRQQGSGTFPMSLAAWAMQPLDVMQFTFPYFGWTEKYLEVVGIGFMVGDRGDGQTSVACSVMVQETAASVYEWSTTEEQNIYDAPAMTFTPYTPPPPTNLTLTSGQATALITLDGVLHPRIEVQWDEPLDILTTQIQVQYAAVTNPSIWIDNGPVDVANTLCYIEGGIVAGQSYNVRIRGLRANGVASPWVEEDGYTVSITLSVVGILALAPGSLVAEAFNDGTAEIIVSGFTASVGNASVAVLPGGAQTVLTGLAQQQTYFVYYVDPSFTGGAISPVATQTESDFLNKPGFFMIDSITTPYAAASGSSTSTRYAPSNYTDNGSRTTSNPANAYDNNTSTAAVVGANSTYAPGDDTNSTSTTSPASTQAAAPIGGGGTTRTTFGSIMYEDFASYVTTAAMILNVVASFITSGGQATISAAVGGTSASLASLNSTAATATYTLALPVGTNLGSVTVSFDVAATPSGTTSSSASLSVFEIFVQ